MFSRMSPATLSKLVHVDPGLSELQKRDVEDIGFGSLLRLRIDELPWDLCCSLVQNFDPYNCCLNLLSGQKMKISIEDVYVCLGLPKGTKEIVEGKSKETTKDYVDLRNEWFEYIGFDKNVSVSSVMNRIKQDVDGSENFKRSFVVLVVSTLIKENQNTK